LSSPSKEVAVLARLVGRDASTNTGRNILNISLETHLWPRTSPINKFHDALSKPADIPPECSWRISLLQKYANIRKTQFLACEDTTYIDTLIDSLCST
jgi:hypothetical protein